MRILQKDFTYYILLIITIIIFLISINITKESTYKKIKNEQFKIIEKTKKDYGIKLILKGKEKVLAYLYIDKDKIDNEYNKYDLGDTITITAQEKEIKQKTLDNTFDYKKYLNNQKIYKEVEITNIKINTKNKNIFYKIKNKIIKRQEKIPKSKPYINSLILGNNSYLDEDVITSYKKSGISHLFAISGTHINILLTILYTILKKLKLKENKISIITILFLIYYMFLTNFSMSVLRASIFTILIIINKLLKLNIKNKNLLILTLFIITLNNPRNILNIGLQFSILITYYLITYNKLINNKKTYLKKTLIISYISTLVSLPILVNSFYQINTLSVIYNLFFVPYISFVLLPFTLITYIFPPFDNILKILIDINENLSLLVSNINISNIIIKKLSIPLIIIYYILITINFRKMQKNNNKFNIIIIMFIIFLSLRTVSSNQITFIDVDQGDSILITINNKTILIDTGGNINYKNKEYKYQISKNKILPYMKSIGIKKVDYLILTHGDQDHMKESIYLVENFKIKKVIFNCGSYNELEKELIKVLDKKKIKYYSCIKELNIDNNILYFLQTKEYDNENDNSNVIYTELNGYKFMFMGDAGADKEKDILDKYNISDIDVLKVGHHGSRTSSSKEFIDKIKPKYSIISVGKNNRYNHPNKEVLNTLDNSKIYRTDKDGSIMFKIKNNKLKIKTCSP